MRYSMHVNGTLVTVAELTPTWFVLRIGHSHLSHWTSLDNAIVAACKVLENRRRAA